MFVKRKVIVDTDVGCDDAVAILMALADANTDIIAFTTVFGNVSCQQATENLDVINSVFGTSIPVYPGASSPFVGPHHIPKWPGHGANGLGDAVFPNVKPNGAEAEVAAVALVRLAKANPGLYDLIALGPLTNLALAIKLDPLFPSRLHSCVIMGGNYLARGNAGLNSEFNFFSDPEAAHVVFYGWEPTVCPAKPAPFVMVSWEVTEDHPIRWDEFDALCAGPSTAANFLKKVSSSYEKCARTHHHPPPKVLAEDPEESKVDGVIPKPVDLSAGQHDTNATAIASEPNIIISESAFTPCDAYAMAVLLQPDIVTKQKDLYAAVEIGGLYSRGTVAIDWYGHLSKPPHITVVQKLDRTKFLALLRHAVETDKLPVNNNNNHKA